MDYIKKDLPNGIRLRAVKIPQSPTVTFAVLVGAGSRNESPELSGIAHFIEHNVFKGTPSLPSSQQVSDAIESVGGIQNAFTSHEYTGYWAKAGAGKLSELSKVVSDIFLHPLFPEKDLDIERGNVIEELNMYEDNPMQKIIREFLQITFSGHPLGQNIIGTKENLQRFSRKDLLNFKETFYDPRRIMVIAAGDFDENKYFDDSSKIYSAGSLNNRVEREASSLYKVNQKNVDVRVINKKLDQAHLVLGFRSFGIDDPREEALDVVNEILGAPGSGSSRLFHRIREELGLAYYVSSDTQTYKEAGLWLVRAGVRTDKMAEAVRAILEEYDRFTQEPVKPAELARVKEHIKGKLAFELETSDGVMDYYGLNELTRERFETPEEKMAKIDAVTAEEILTLSRELVNKNKLTIAVLGPFDENEEID